MKICFWMTSLFSLGGTKRVVTLLANELSKRNDVTIMCHDNRRGEDRTMYDLSDRVKVDYLNIYEYSSFDRRDPHTLHRAMVRKINDRTGFYNCPGRADELADSVFSRDGLKPLAEYINSQNYDVVIATARLALVLAMLAPDLKCRTVGWQHNCYDGYLHVKNVVFWKKEILLQKYLPQLDAYVVLSKYDQEDYRNKLNIQTRVMTNPRSFVSSQRTDLSRKRFIVAARFVKQKGLDLLIESFREFAEQDDEWELVIIGDGPLFKSVQKKIEKCGLSDRVHLPGYTKDVIREYLDASVMLFPSRYEGWGLVVIEANECGLPVIAYNIRPLDLIIRNGETGYLTEPFDTHAFADAMLEMAHNPDLLKKMSDNTKEANDQYDIKIIGAEWESFLSAL